eukprot:1733336-Amphidinium_carterae.1
MATDIGSSERKATRGALMTWQLGLQWSSVQDKEENKEAEQGNRIRENQSRGKTTTRRTIRLLGGLANGTEDTKSIQRYELPTTQRNNDEPPTIFEGNNKGNLSAGPITTFKNWSAKVTTYLFLRETKRIQEILDHVKVQTSPIRDENYNDARLAKKHLHYTMTRG